MDNTKYNVTLLYKHTVCKIIETCFLMPFKLKAHIPVVIFVSIRKRWHNLNKHADMMSHVFMLIMELQPGSSWAWLSTKPGNSWRQIAWVYLPAPLTGIASQAGSTDFRRSLLLQPPIWRWFDASTNVTYYLDSEIQVAVSQQLDVEFHRLSP